MPCTSRQVKTISYDDVTGKGANRSPFAQVAVDRATEYSADEDFCTSDWLPREFKPLPENYAEWAAMGEIDMRTKKRNAVASDADPINSGGKAS